MSKKYEFITLCGVFGGQGRVPMVFPSLNCLSMINTRTGATKYWNPQEDYPGEQFAVQEPVFIPRSKDAPEGDGWVLSMVERLERRVSFLVLLDTRNFACCHNQPGDALEGTDPRKLGRDPGG
jgi:carotenoid cleavage dioxygenase-like enzyme